MRVGCGCKWEWLFFVYTTSGLDIKSESGCELLKSTLKWVIKCGFAMVFFIRWVF